VAECYFDVQLDVIRMEYAVHNWRRRRQGSVRERRQRHQRDYSAMDPFLLAGALPAVLDGAAGLEQLGYINNPKFDELVTKARQTFDPPRAMSRSRNCTRPPSTTRRSSMSHRRRAARHEPQIKGFVQPKSWLVDLADHDDAVGRRSGSAGLPSPLVGEGGSRNAKPGEVCLQRQDLSSAHLCSG